MIIRGKCPGCGKYLFARVQERTTWSFDAPTAKDTLIPLSLEKLRESVHSEIHEELSLDEGVESPDDLRSPPGEPGWRKKA